MSKWRSVRVAVALSTMLIGALLGWLSFELLAPDPAPVPQPAVADSKEGQNQGSQASQTWPSDQAVERPLPPASEANGGTAPLPAKHEIPPHLDYPPLAFVTRTGPAVGVPLLVKPKGAVEPVAMATNVNGVISLAKLGDPSPEVKLDTAEWRVVDVSGDLMPAGWFRPFPGPPVILERTRKLQLSVRYADGLPYNGHARVSTVEDEDGEVSREVVEEVPVSRGEAVAIVSDDVPTQVGVISRRPGFASISAVWEPRSPPGRRLEIVLDTEEPTKGMLEIDLARFPADARVHVRVQIIIPGQEWHGGTFVTTTGGRVYATGAIDAGTYRLFVWQDAEVYQNNYRPRAPKPREDPSTPGLALTWQMEGVKVTAGEVTRVLAEAVASAAVKARIVDEYGMPLLRSRIYVDSDRTEKGATNWSNLNSSYEFQEGKVTAVRSERWGFADKAGVATLPWAHPGKRTIAVESPGLDVKFIDVDLPAGTLVDLGEVALTEPASGVIEVEIVNHQPGTEYVIRLAPFVAGSMEHIPMKSGRHRIEGLHLRWYTVNVNSSNAKLSAWSQNIKLSQDRRRVRVKFEMLRPPLPQDPWPPIHIPQEDLD